MAKNVALVLSGGGARGIAHIGIINELLDRGYNITSIAGTSMGALVGGIYASGKLDEFATWMKQLDRFKILKLIDFTFSSNGFIKGNKILNNLKNIVGEAKIEDLPIPYVAVATDILTRSEIVFTEGSIFEAIRASISIPTVFTPVEKDSKILVDGGLLNNLPNNHVDQSDCDFLFSVNVNAQVPLLQLEMNNNEKAIEKERKTHSNKLEKVASYLKSENKNKQKVKLGYFDIINKTISTMIDNNAQVSLEKVPPDLLFEISRDCADTYDFYKFDYLIQLGRKTAKIELDKFEKELQEKEKAEALEKKLAEEQSNKTFFDFLKSKFKKE